MEETEATTTLTRRESRLTDLEIHSSESCISWGHQSQERDAWIGMPTCVSFYLAQSHLSEIMISKLRSLASGAKALYRFLVVLA